MNSIVIHYKELALKGRNRPWFVKVLNRNLRTALAGLSVASIRSVMGRIEIEPGPRSSWTDVRERLSRVFGIANFHALARASRLRASGGEILEGLGDRHPPLFVSAAGWTSDFR